MKELIKIIVSLFNGLVSLTLFVPLVLMFGLLGGIICSLIIFLPIYILFYLWGDIVIFLSSIFEPYFGNGGFIFLLVCILSFVVVVGIFWIISIYSTQWLSPKKQTQNWIIAHRWKRYQNQAKKEINQIKTIFRKIFRFL